MSALPARALTVDFVSDVVCPWCFIGLRRLESALALLAAERPATGVALRWHPFELNPDLPPAGIDRRAYLDAKFGGAQRAAQIYERVRAVGATVGISFAFERIVRQPNTRDAHRLIAWAQERGDAGTVVERLFTAYFIDGLDIGNRAVLAAIAGDAGLDATVVRSMLDSSEGADAILSSEQRAIENGIAGVPFYIFNRRVAVSGAQEPDVLAGAIAESLQLAPG